MTPTTSPDVESFLAKNYPVLIVFSLLIFAILVVLYIIGQKMKKLYHTSAGRRLPTRSWDSFESFQTGYLHENISNLEYQKEYELDPRNIVFSNKYLGKGHYGVVVEATLNVAKQWKKKGVLSHFCKKEEKISVAVKQVPTENIKNKEMEEAAMRMLFDELKIMCAVGQHPNIVTLVGAVTCNNRLFVIVEKCEKNSLYNYLTEKRPNQYCQYVKPTGKPQFDSNGYLITSAVIPQKSFPIKYSPLPTTELKKDTITTAELLSFAWQVANGMKHLASIRCVHRDLAARNVLITSDGICKVSDFGMARNVAEKEYYRLKSHLPLPVRWMAPEAIVKATVMSDMWSYGILLYEIFSVGNLPYNDLNPEEVLFHVQNGRRNEQPTHAHDEVYAFMRACWNLEPTLRPNFKDAVRKMENHFNLSAREMFQEVEKKIKIESKKQEQLAMDRREAKKSPYPHQSCAYYFPCGIVTQTTAVESPASTSSEASASC